MSVNVPSPAGSAALAAPVFASGARAVFAQNYPETPHLLAHGLAAHPLLELDALAALAESLPERSVEYNRGNLPIGIDGKPGATGLGIGETIRDIANSNSWAALKNIEQSPHYAALLADLLGELAEVITPRTGRMMKTQGFIFVSSPLAVTPYHFDPEHNILLQLRGAKEMTVFPAGDAHFAPDRVHESYHTGGARELSWDEAFAPHGRSFALAEGQAIYVPVMSPHFVRNGAASSISLSITWRSEWSFAEADARAFNKLARRLGFSPAAPGRWPSGNRAKAMAWRVLRRIPGLA